MRTITYVSTVKTSLSEEEISKLLESAKASNNRNGIKGLFMYADGNFFQILEGEEKAVSLLFDKIQNDPRHYDIIKLLDKTIEAVSFELYNSSFSVVHDQHDLRELHRYLKKAKEYNPDGFKSLSYITKKFTALI